MANASTETNEDLPKVAVCLAAYNGRRWISEQVESILSQSAVQVTLFISVDCSTDGTEEWVEKRAQSDSRIVVMPQGKRFGRAARNFFRLIKEVNFSSFDYVSLADQDDIWNLDKLLRAIEVMRDSNADIYSSNVVAFWPSGRRVLIRKSQPQKERDFLFEAAGPGCTYVMRVGFVRALQAKLEAFWEDVQSVDFHDWFIYAYARAHGYQWQIDHRPSMLYRQHAENQLGANAGWHALVHRVRSVQSGWWFGQAVLIARLIGMENDAYVLALQRGQLRTNLWLATQAGKCRRRFRDQLYFAALCIFMCFVRDKRY